MTTIEQVKEFHKAFGHPVNEHVAIDNPARNILRIDLLVEEVSELTEALNKRDPLAVLDALTDIQYVLDGAYLSLGFYRVKDDAFSLVHIANMAKLTNGRPIIREDGKVLKPAGWKPANLQPCLSWLK